MATNTVHPNTNSTPTLISIALSSPTESSLPPTPTLASNDIIQNCLKFKDQEISLLDITNSGTVVVTGNFDETPYLLNLQTGNRYDLPLDDKANSALYGVHPSPDGNKLAYVEDIRDPAKKRYQQVIWVIDAEGNVLSRQEINPDILFSEWRWLDDENLHFNFSPATPNDGTAVLFNPFTKEWRDLSNKLINFFPYFNVHHTAWLVEYNPDLEWVVYLSNEGSNEFGPVVWDLKSDRKIWGLWGDAFQNTPKWSPTGEELGVIVDGNFYRVNRDGQSLPLPKIEQESKIASFSWAPNGMKIALLVQEKLKGYLMLYNVQDNQIVNYCIESDNLTGIFPPVWSLDSKLVSFRTVVMKVDGPSGALIVLDTQDDVAYKVPENLEPLAWMRSKP